MRTCPNCGSVSGAGDAFCAACGAPLTQAGRGRVVILVSALVTVLVLGGVLFWLLTSSEEDSVAGADNRDPISQQSTTEPSDALASSDVGQTATAPPQTTTTTEPPPPSTTTTLAPTVALPRSEVQAAASSVLPSNNDRYAPELTLDGQLETAWNHCGTGCSELSGDARQGVGVRLTYSFDEPVELVAIRIANGYQKVHETLGDVWPKNNRIASLEIRTQNSFVFATLADERGYQEIAAALGVTTWVEMTVTGVYYGDGTYNDLAVSEIEFLVRRVTAGA